MQVAGHSRPEDGPLAATTARWGAASGTPYQLANLLRAYAAEGFSRVGIWLDPSTPEGIDELAEALAILDRG